MNCFGILFAFAFFFLIAIASTAPARNRAKRQKDLFRKLAHRFGGVFFGGGWFDGPAVRFRHGNLAVSVEMLGRNAAGLAGECQVKLNWPDISFYGELVSGAKLSPPTWRTRLISFDAEPFRDRFSIFADDEKKARAFFSKSIQYEIDRLERTSQTMAIRMTISRSYVTFERHGIGTVDSVEEFVRQCLRLYAQSQLAHAEGISFVNEDEVIAIENANCPICGESVVDNVAYCRRCKTVHHIDCWQYNGRCATYGCGELQFATPVQVPIAEPPTGSTGGEKI